MDTLPYILIHLGASQLLWPCSLGPSIRTTTENPNTGFRCLPKRRVVVGRGLDRGDDCRERRVGSSSKQRRHPKGKQRMRMASKSPCITVDSPTTPIYLNGCNEYRRASHPEASARADRALGKPKRRILWEDHRAVSWELPRRREASSARHRRAPSIATLPPCQSRTSPPRGTDSRVLGGGGGGGGMRVLRLHCHHIDALPLQVELTPTAASIAAGRVDSCCFGHLSGSRTLCSTGRPSNPFERLPIRHRERDSTEGCVSSWRVSPVRTPMLPADRERERQTDIQTDRQTDRGRQRQRRTERERER